MTELEVINTWPVEVILRSSKKTTKVERKSTKWLIYQVAVKLSKSLPRRSIYRRGYLSHAQVGQSLREGHVATRAAVLSQQEGVGNNTVASHLVSQALVQRQCCLVRG